MRTTITIVAFGAGVPVGTVDAVVDSLAIGGFINMMCGARHSLATRLFSVSEILSLRQAYFWYGTVTFSGHTGGGLHSPQQNSATYSTWDSVVTVISPRTDFGPGPSIAKLISCVNGGGIPDGMLKGPFQAPTIRVSFQKPLNSNGSTFGRETEVTHGFGLEIVGNLSTKVPPVTRKSPYTETRGTPELLAKTVQIRRLGQLKFTIGPTVKKVTGNGVGLVVMGGAAVVDVTGTVEVGNVVGVVVVGTVVVVVLMVEVDVVGLQPNPQQKLVL